MNSDLRIAVIVLAAGSGSRFAHATNKVWLPLKGIRIISRSLLNATESFDHCRAILVINPADAELAKKTLAQEVSNLNVEVILGGATRHESEFKALAHLAPDIESEKINVILIHDGARPLATGALFEQIAEAAFHHGGAIPTIPVSPNEMDLLTDERVVRVQTPQAFLAKELLSAYRQAFEDGFLGTDTAACMEKYCPGDQIIAVPGETSNIKITHPQDLTLAEKILRMRLK